MRRQQVQTLRFQGLGTLASCHGLSLLLNIGLNQVRV